MKEKKDQIFKDIMNKIIQKNKVNSNFQINS